MLSTDYEVGLVFRGRQSSVNSLGGQKWTIQYNSTTNVYRFINAEDPTLLIGHYNIAQLVVSWTRGVQNDGTPSAIYSSNYGTPSAVHSSPSQTNQQYLHLENTGDTK